MRAWHTGGVLVVCLIAGVAGTWALDGYRRARGMVPDAADPERVPSHKTARGPVAERTRFDHTLLVKTPSGNPVRLDVGRGKHIVQFAGCTRVYVKATAGQLVAIAHDMGAKLSCILVSEIHPDDLRRGKSAADLLDYRASKVREFLGPSASVYFDIVASGAVRGKSLGPRGEWSCPGFRRQSAVRPAVQGHYKPFADGLPPFESPGRFRD
jgi:hypothetical protein